MATKKKTKPRIGSNKPSAKARKRSKTATKKSVSAAEIVGKKVKSRGSSARKNATGIKRPRVTDKEITKARKLAQRKKGTTRKEVAERLKVSPVRAKSIIDKAMQEGKWNSAPKGSGKDGRTLIYTCAK